MVARAPEEAAAQALEQFRREATAGVAMRRKVLQTVSNGSGGSILSWKSLRTKEIRV